MRPWFLLTEAGIPFTEENIKLDRPDTRQVLSEKSPSGLVPFLQHGDIAIWDSLAICEYLNELFPEKQLWPEDPKARAIARAISAEMHSGFSNLRTVWPMQVLKTGIQHLTTGGVQKDIERIDQLWAMARRKFGAKSDSGGDFLFGKFSIADAIYAPVASRFVTYGPVKLSPEASDYRDMILASPTMDKWIAGAQEELAA